MRTTGFLMLLGLFACNGGEPNPTDPNPTGEVPTEETDCTDEVDNDQDGATDCSDPDCDGDAACIETDCDDEMDNDFDGALDCFDPDCANEVYCSWPLVGIDFDVRFSYSASTLAIIAGYNDCVYEASSFLERDRAQTCPGCDRIYCGSLTVGTDTCPPEFDRPSQGCYGFTFTAPSNTWDVFYEDTENSTYTLLGTANESTMTPGLLEVSNTEQIIVQGVDGGSVTGEFGFWPDPPGM